MEVDIFNCGAEALVNPVNCVGVMGAGLALDFKRRFPLNYIAYREMCEYSGALTGKIHAFCTNRPNPSYIFNFPTKVHWNEKSNISYIEEGLLSLVSFVKDLEVQSIAIPALGCGLGGLDWNEVKPLIEKSFEPLPNVKLFLFGPDRNLV